MSTVLTRIVDLGVDATINSPLAQRIRITNIISLMGVMVSFVIVFFALWAEWPPLGIYFVCIMLLSTFVPLILNYYEKSLAGRIFLLGSYNFFILGLSLLFVDTLQYYFLYIPLIFTTFLLLDGNKKILKLVLIGFCIVSLVYLQWYFTAFDPIIVIETSTANVLRLVNNMAVFLVSLGIYYFYVTENDSYVDIMIAQAQDLEEKNTHLEQFAYIAAHDLSEPLRTVNSFIDLIREEGLLDKDQELYFSHIHKAMSRMRAMIDGLLTYSRIGRSSTFEYTDVNELITELKIDLGEVIKEKKAVIISKNLPRLQCHKIEIRQLFQNLITNAIKFQSPGVAPVIQISCIHKKAHWEFCFADNGIGIAPNHLKTIFQIFKKLHLKTEYAGHGIGLAFCEKIVKTHGGNIWVTSIQGKGCKFYFTIPKNIILT